MSSYPDRTCPDRNSAIRPLAVAAAACLLFASPAAAQEHCGGEHVVRPGDTLTAIAARCDSTVAGLVRANAQVSDPDLLLVGWRLTVPEALGHGPPGPEPGPPEAEERAGEDRAEAPAPPPADEPGAIRVAGLVAEGAECPVLRTPGGEVYSLVGPMRFTPGTYVEITGQPVQMSFCMRGTTLEVTSLREVPAPGAQ